MTAEIITPRALKAGSLFSGYGGLDLAISEVFGTEPAWFCEVDEAPTKILAHHWPDVPNLGDITKVDWATVEPIDILTGGFPCQDVSLAGKRAGMKPDTRSGLWTHMAYAIQQLRPRYVVAENVRGLLSAEAHSDMEPCPWCVGDRQNEHLLRALGAVLGDLADLGYDARWYGLRAADVGAPHGRFRVFIVARDAANLVLERDRPVHGVGAGDQGEAGGAGRLAVADADGTTRRERRLPAPGQAEGRGAWPDAGRRGGTSAPDAAERPELRGVTQPAQRDVPRRDGQGPVATADTDLKGSQGAEPARGHDLPAGGSLADAESARFDGRARQDGEQDGRGERTSRPHADRRDKAAADASSDGRHEGRTESAGELGGSDAAERCPSCGCRWEFHDADGFCAGPCGGRHCGGREAVADASSERHGDDRPAGEPWVPAADVPGDLGTPADADRDGRPQFWRIEPDARDAHGRDGADTAWGPYEPAIRRWEEATGRPAPAPTEPSVRGGQRLSPRFVEWMMGLPAGWVTDVPDIPRNAQLRALGNGVVWQQAAAALRALTAGGW